MIRVVIVDDHSLIRIGLKSRIDPIIDMQVVGEASTAAELLKNLSQWNPSVVILDITLPDKNGLDVLKQLKEDFPHIEVIILSMHPEERYALRAYKAGAAGYLSKGIENLSEKVVKAIRMVVTHKTKYVSKHFAPELAKYMYDSERGETKKHQKLSDREFQVLCMIASGKSTAEIAESLSITVQTVYSYRNRAREKLSLQSDVDFTRYAIQNNLID